MPAGVTVAGLARGRDVVVEIACTALARLPVGKPGTHFLFVVALLPLTLLLLAPLPAVGAMPIIEAALKFAARRASTSGRMLGCASARARAAATVRPAFAGAVADSRTTSVQRLITFVVSRNSAVESSRSSARPSARLQFGINLMMNLPSASPSMGRSSHGK